MKIDHFIQALMSLGLAILIAGCGKAGGEPPKEKRSAGIPVATYSVTNASWDKTVSIVGTLFAKDEATIAAQVEGMVERTLVDFGDRVTNGQLIATLDLTSYEAQLQQADGVRAKAEATFTNAVQNFQRVEELRKRNIASTSDFDQANALLGEAEAEVKAARGAQAVAKINVERSQVGAPFDGAIAQRAVGRGDYVKPGSPLFNIVNDAVLKFIFHVPERYGSFVQKRLPVSFNVDNYPGETFTGSVYLISPEVSTTSRSFGVGALVTNTNFRLKANTFARGTLVLERGVAVKVVPVDAIVSFAGVSKVFVVEGGVARGRTVMLGRIRDGLQEIVEGIKSGDKVVVSGQSKLSDGTAVVVQPDESTRHESR